jgi:phosphate transport system substrate-binding protein
MSKVSFIQNFIIIASQTVLRTDSNKVETIIKDSFKSISLIIVVVSFLLTSCMVNGTRVPNETPTSGNIRILVDESFAPLLETEVSTFTTLYRNAKIEPVYRPEVDVINYFMNDSAKVMVTSRKLSDDQIKYLRDTLIVARTTTFAYDALALIINRSNPDSLLKFDEIKGIFDGNITSWKNINRRTRLDRIRVIFDNPKSANIRYFKDLFDIKDELPGNFYAVNSNLEVINFVENNTDAMGIISVNWISDKDDSLSRSFIKKVKVVAVSRPYLDDGSYYRPDQGFIYDKSYPFVREIYLISRETFAGLGSGFINWACAEQGQRIVLKSGLVPATMPIRLVQIKQ